MDNDPYNHVATTHRLRGRFLFQPTPGDLQVNPFPRLKVKRGSHLVIPICSPVVLEYLRSTEYEYRVQSVSAKVRNTK